MSEDFADSIADQIQSLEIGQLLAVCDQFNVVVPDDKKEKRGAVVRLLTKFVDEKVEADDEDALGQVDGELGKILKTKVKPKETDQPQQIGGGSASVPTEKVDVKQVVVEVKEESSSSTKVQQQQGTTGGSDVDLVRQKVDLLRGLRAREFKVDGAVGRGAGCIDYQNLLFQIKKGKTNGYTADEIRNGVIKAMKAGSSMHRYFQNTDDITEEEFMEMLHSYYVIQVQNASTIFNKMVGSAQEPDEEAGDYAFRVLEMCKSIVKLSLKEDQQWDSTLVRNSCLHTLSVGFREHSIRSELREFLKDSSKSDNEIFQEVSKAELRDAECKEKMRGKGGVQGVCSAVEYANNRGFNKNNNQSNNNVYNSNHSNNNMYNSNNMQNNDAVNNHRQNSNAGNMQNNNMQNSNAGNNIQNNNAPKNNMNHNQQQNNGGDISSSAENRILAAVTKLNDKVDDIGKVVSRVDKLEAGFEAFKVQMAASGNGGGGKKGIKCAVCEPIPGSYCKHCNKCGEEGHKRKNCPN